MSPADFSYRSSPRVAQALFLSLLFCALIYAPGLFGGFLVDDFANIVQNPALRSMNGSFSHWIALAFSSDAGILRRPLSMLSFGIDYSFFGLSPLAFKIVNLIFHLANGLLFYKLSCRLIPRLGCTAFSAPQLSLLVTALWLLHPLNVSSVLYIVQRMNLLASLFTLAGLHCYVIGRERMLSGNRGLAMALCGLLAFGTLATLSKENGALIAVYALVIEAICYRFTAPTEREARLLKTFFWLTVALPIALFVAYALSAPQWLLHGYAWHDFTLHQRLLTESRILCDYIAWTFAPLPRWLGVSHDDIAISTGVLNPISTAAAIAFLFALAISAWILRKRSPGFAFGIAWFLVGHAMESTVLPLQLVFEHRNYLPIAGLILGITCAASRIAVRIAPRLVTVIAGSFVLLFGGLTMARTRDWSSELRLALSEVAHHPESARAQYEAGRQIVFSGTAAGHRQEAEQQAIPYFEKAKVLDSTDLFSASSLIFIRSKEKTEVSAQDVADLANRVKQIKQPLVNPFLSVLSKASDGSVRIDGDQMKLLVYSALENPVLSHQVRALILNNYGRYQYHVAHDQQAAVSLSMAAAAEDPNNPLIQIDLTRLALETGNKEEAARHYSLAKQLDKSGSYAEAISELNRQISATQP